MSSETLRVALIGAAGKVAAPCPLHAWEMVNTGELVAVCDVDQQATDHTGDARGLQEAVHKLRSVARGP